jgi:hypothetical protein
MVRRSGLPLTPLAEKLSDLIRKAAHNFTLQLENHKQTVPIFPG